MLLCKFLLAILYALAFDLVYVNIAHTNYTASLYILLLKLTKTENRLAWQERQRRQRTLRMLMMFLMILLLMDGDEQNQRQRQANRLRQQQLRNKHNSKHNTNYWIDEDGNIIKPLPPSIYKARTSQDILINNAIKNNLNSISYII